MNRGAEPSKRETHVVYIAGSGRSGSTILDRILGSVPGTCSCGELQRVWDVYYQPGRLCGCGSGVRECSFWRDVLASAFGEVSEQTAKEYEELRLRLTRTRNLAHFFSPLKSRRFQNDLARYQGILQSLYEALADVSGAEVIIDSSKGAGYGWILASLPRIQFSVLNLVRDSRAVANSWLHRSPLHSGRPSHPWTASYSAAHWDIEHAFAELLRLRARRHLTIRYEDFAKNPRETLDGIAEGLSIPVPTVSEDGVIEQSDAHLIAGNRSRHLKGRVEIREDQRWMQELGLVDAAKVTALTWPLLLRHGYSIAYRKPNT